MSNPARFPIEKVAAARAGDQQARAELVEGGLPLVDFFARRYSFRTHLDYDTLFSAGQLGLLRAVDRMDQDREEGASSYARTSVKRAMLREIDREIRRWKREQRVRAQRDAEEGQPCQRLAALEDAEQAAWLRDLIDRTLAERERVLIGARFGLDGQEPATLAAAGELLGVCRERARQIERKALSRLQRALRKESKRHRGATHAEE